MLKLAKFAKASCLGGITPGANPIGIPIVAGMPIIPWFIIGGIPDMPIEPVIMFGMPMAPGMGPGRMGLVGGRMGIMPGVPLMFIFAKLCGNIPIGCGTFCCCIMAFKEG